MPRRPELQSDRVAAEEPLDGAGLWPARIDICQLSITRRGRNGLIKPSHEASKPKVDIGGGAAIILFP